MIRHLDVLLAECSDIYKDTYDGKAKKKEDKEGPTTMFDVQRDQIDLKLLSARDLVDAINNRSNESKTEQDFHLKREGESLFEEIRHDIDELDKIIKEKEETGYPVLSNLMIKENGCTWKIAALARNTVEPSFGISSYIYMISEIKNFSDFTEDPNFGDKTDLEQRLGAPKEEQKIVDKLYKMMDKDGDGKIGTQDLHVFTKRCELIVRRCKHMFLLKKQLDYLDHKFKPETFRRKLRLNKNKVGAFNYGENGVMGLGGDGEGNAPLGKAGKMLQKRREKERNSSERNSSGPGGSGSGSGASYRPQEPSQQELQFMERSKLKEEQWNEQMDEMLLGVKRIGQMAVDIGQELDAQEEIMDELADRMDVVESKINEGIDKLEELLEKSGGASKWCPRLIAFIVIMAIVGYLVKGNG